MREIMIKLTLYLTVVCVIVSSVGCEDSDGHYSNSWAVEVHGGRDVADRIADTHGFVNMGQVGGIPDVYHFIHTASPTRSRRALDEKHRDLKDEDEVVYVEQQVIKKRSKRDHTHYTIPHDPLWKKQWYMHSDKDMNIQSAWERGITGQDVVVTILDDGIERDHPDLQDNYDPNASYDFNAHDSDPMPRYNPSNENKHGTRCAGEVAALKNDKCNVGVAYNAKIGGVRMLDGDVTDIIEANSLSLNPQHIDIYSSSWGPNDDGRTIEGPAVMAHRAFVNGITQGRGGKGSIFVWAAGNGATAHDNCNCDGYAASPYTIAVSSVSERDNHPWYGEECAANMAATFSSGSSGEKQVVTTDLHHKCTEHHTGTSASAPMAAGLIALVLEANANLTWRDVQYIIVYSSNPDIPKDNNAVTNGAGLKVGTRYGFGVMDAAALVNRALYWSNVPQQLSCNISVELSNKDANHKSSLAVRVEVDRTKCPSIGYLEHIQAVVNISMVQGTRGNVRIDLQSPSNTLATLLPHRKSDMDRKGIKDWPFMSVQTWGENPIGLWKLTVTTQANTKARVNNFNLLLYGVSNAPESVARIPDQCSDQCVGGCAGAGPEHCDVCKGYRMSTTHKCVSNCPPGTFTDGHICYPCMSHCVQCTDDSTCTLCDQGVLKLPSGGCGHSCPDSTYLDTDANKCVACHTACLDCTGPGDNQCSSCHSSQYNLTNGQCLLHTHCPSKQYFDSRMFECRMCHRDCVECQGRESTDCTACASGNTLVNGVCVYNNECKDGEYFSDETTACAQCPPGCSSCEDEHMCTSCDSTHHLYTSRVADTDILRSSCVTKCPDGYYSGHGMCNECPPFCATCDAASTCTACALKGAKVLNGACPQPCKSTEYYDGSSCSKCPAAHCHSCISKDVCTSCVEGKYLWLNGSCHNSCPNHTVANIDSGRCESTHCHDSCLTCSGTEANQCLSCAEPLKLYDDTCVEGCDKGKYFTGTECKSCDQSCDTCSGPTDADCEICPRDRYLDHGHCLTSCRLGSYADDGGVCISCSMGCSECVSDSECNKCSTGYTLVDKHCTINGNNDNGTTTTSRTSGADNTIYTAVTGTSPIKVLVVILCLLIAALVIVMVGVIVWKRKHLHQLLTNRHTKQYQVLYTANTLDINGIDDFDMSDGEIDVFTKLGK